jgi:Integrase zinc binding domain
MHLYLTQFNLWLEYTPGHKLVIPDVLLQKSNHNKAEPVVVAVIPPEMIIGVVDLDLQQHIQLAYQQDAWIQEVFSKASYNGVAVPKEVLSKEGLLFIEGQLWLPDDIDIKREVCQMAHELSGHPGKQRTLDHIKEDYFWPGLAHFVQNYMVGCLTCQECKVNTHPSNPGFSPLEVTDHPFQFITMDFITNLPLSEGCDSIFMVVDQGLTKVIVLLPCNKTIDELGVIKLLIKNVFSKYGLPDKIVLDQEPQFVSHVFQLATEWLSIASCLSTAFHPQTDGESECVNQEVSTHL